MPTFSHPNIDIYTLYQLLQQRHFGVEYQPIIDLHTNTIMGWEALARFYTTDNTPIRPDWVFEALHADELCLFNIEYQMKKLQLAHAPKEGLLFLNIDPHAFAVFGDHQSNPLLALLVDKHDVVIEIIENTDANDARHSSAMSHAFKKQGLLMALDDVGDSNSMLSFEVLLHMDYLKLDRSWLTHRHKATHRYLLEALCSFAHRSGKKLILEGVENEQDLRFARKLGVNYVQGFLYRPQFRQYSPTSTSKSELTAAIT
ncbi:EAL domain-containing protein [Oceanisphaera pacifica]|uniref:EAL domain-containing protein n=1 Tax=Oceanisphaera pacifica TaxID=2818389 RepID=A0ABS3NC03_9GAMM|nr:EAL domain-containing protein [Oceanisphaera pacifica]MBO1518122.1 EAL domain-containing protein [Oceanisphaera pacifica]